MIPPEPDFKVTKPRNEESGITTSIRTLRQLIVTFVIATAGNFVKDFFQLLPPEVDFNVTKHQADESGIVVSDLPLIGSLTIKETIGIIENFVEPISEVVLEEVFGVIDTVQKSSTRFLSEVSGIIDDLFVLRTAIAEIEEIIGVIDTFSYSLKKLLSEEIASIDEIVLLFRRTFSEVVSFIDIHRKSPIIILKPIFGLIDQLRRIPGDVVSLVENIRIIENEFPSPSKRVENITGMVEESTLAPIKIVEETVGIIDSFISDLIATGKRISNVGVNFAPIIVDDLFQSIFGQPRNYATVINQAINSTMTLNQTGSTSMISRTNNSITVLNTRNNASIIDDNKNQSN